MGRYLLYALGGLMVVFSTTAIMLDQGRLGKANANSRSLAFAKAKNLSTSGAYMAVSKMSLDNTWKDGFSTLALGDAAGKVWIEDHFSNSSLSSSEKMIISVATFDDAAETTMVTLRTPPDLGNFAVYATKEVDNINVYNEYGFKDKSLLVENAGSLPPIDWTAIEALAIAQEQVDGNGSHIIAGNGNGGKMNDDDEDDDDDDEQDNDNGKGNSKNKGNSGKNDDGDDDDDDKGNSGKNDDDDDDKNGGKKDDDCSFYFKDKIPSVTVVYGDLKVSGNTKICGIYVVYGNFIMNGNVQIEGVVAMPKPGTAVMHGGGNPKLMNITGGMVVDAGVTGTGNHVSVKYKPEYMSIFSNFQKESGVMITRWLETPAY